MTEHLNDDGTPNEENIKKLRKQAEEAGELKTQVAQLQQQLAVRDSKIDTDHAAYELFKKGYDGDWTPDALNTAAEKYGLLKSDKAPTGDGAGNQQQSQQAPPTGQQGMEFSDQQVAWMRNQGIQLPGMSGPGDQATGGFGDQFADQAASLSRMDQAQAGGTSQSPGQIANQDYLQAKNPEQALALYKAAGGTVSID